MTDRSIFIVGGVGEVIQTVSGIVGHALLLSG